ncbi:hypothetical protein A3F57_04030 [Candidatus Roizmanbacteria bacterium RIFCSPHIGHO2_12_FULL_36_11]|nr:MAG: hypothetical protein A3F57_04030 [Candidatus Roizmanbacteria bacterium RIFCSPHIGHO2_12_FULL_36_11]
MKDQKSFLVLLLIFYLTIWLINPSNKLALFLSLVFLVILAFKLKHLPTASYFTYLATLILPMGKKYTVVLHDLREFPTLKIFYPLGLFTDVTISISDVIFSIFVLNLIIDLFRNSFKQLKAKKFEPLDILVVAFFSYGVFADLSSSTRPILSLVLKKELFEIIIVYLSLRFYFKQTSTFIYSLILILSTIVFFESFIAIQQFIISSPLGKNFEVFHSIEVFGGVADELVFTFRPLGTFSHANTLGLFLASLLPLIFFFFLKKSSFFIIPISFFFGLASLILTLSRSAWFAFFVAISYLLFIMERRLKINLLKYLSLKKFALFTIIFLPLLVYLLPRVARTVYSTQESGGLSLRIKQVSESMGLLTSHPLTGVGTGMSVVKMIERNWQGVFASFPSAVHNYYILLALENGIPTLILLAVIIFIAIKKLLSLKKSFAYTCIGSLYVILLGAIFQPFFNYQVFFMLLGINFGKIIDNVETV